MDIKSLRIFIALYTGNQEILENIHKYIYFFNCKCKPLQYILTNYVLFIYLFTAEDEWKTESKNGWNTVGHNLEVV